MPVNEALNPTSAPNGAGGNTSSLSAAGKSLDKDAFLKILIAQLKYQDPLSPTSSETFINQLVQFTMMEQMMNLTSQFNRLVLASDFNQAVALIGRRVVIVSSDGMLEGTVEKVGVVNGEVMITVDGVAYNLNQVSEVAGETE